MNRPPILPGKMMRFLLPLLMILLHSNQPLGAQSLARRLQSEPVQTLVRDARNSGDPVRGAILFVERKQGCVNCHAVGQNRLLGPDLTRPGPRTGDEHLVESLLRPSRYIRPGFEISTILLMNGKTLSGRILERSDKQIILRENVLGYPLRTLPLSEIEEISGSSVSSMPAQLVDQLADRQQFLDLVRYVMEITDTGSAESGNQDSGGATVRAELIGRVLIDEYQCGQCHQIPESVRSVSPRQAPNLNWSGARLHHGYLARFISDPARTKPGTSMPDLLQNLNPSQRQEAVQALSQFVQSLQPRPPVRHSINDASAARGRELFHSIGCVACHAPRDDSGDELATENAVPLGKIEQKHSVAGLQEFLENPRTVRPLGRMPDMQLTHWEALDLAHYLAGGHSKSDVLLAPADPLDQELIKTGRRLFAQLGCVNCHPVTDSPRIAAPVLSPDPSALQRGCLDPKDRTSPRFAISAQQRNSIKAALMDKSKLNADDQVNLTLTTLRCLNCHQRDELGGVTESRIGHFQTTDPNLGPQGRIPPALTGIGNKLKSDWLRQVLVSGKSIRPYMKTRMPVFGAKQVEHLVPLFAEADQLEPFEFSPFDDQKKMRETGFELVGRDGLNCIACHTFQLKPAGTMSAVDLTEMADRLQHGWFYRYMKEPQRLSRNTVMPTFWPGGRAIRRDVLDGQADAQIEALWQYLLDGRQARQPRGLIIEPIQLLASHEAVMLRRSYPNIGKRGIGVGYPAGVNLAFDAEQLRLATIWSGPFADPGGVWRGQGHGRVRPLGQKPLQFGPGPDLDDATAPRSTEDGRPVRHRFRGYSLDEKRRPRFRYQFDEIEVEDYFVDAKDTESGAPVLRRTMTLKTASPRPAALLRIASGQSIRKHGDQQFRVEDQVNVHIIGSHVATITKNESGQTLGLDIDIPAGRSQIIIEYQW